MNHRDPATNHCTLTCPRVYDQHKRWWSLLVASSDDSLSFLPPSQNLKCNWCAKGLGDRFITMQLGRFIGVQKALLTALLQYSYVSSLMCKRFWWFWWSFPFSFFFFFWSLWWFWWIVLILIKSDLNFKKIQQHPKKARTSVKLTIITSIAIHANRVLQLHFHDKYSFTKFF